MDEELSELMNRVFNGNMDNMLLWLNAPNGNFGGSTPWKLIEADKAHKVILFLESVLKGYQ